MSEKEEKEGATKEVDSCSRRGGEENGMEKGETRGEGAKIASPEMVLIQAARKGSVIEALRRLNEVDDESVLKEPELEEIPEKYIISTRVLIFILLLLGGAGGGVYFLNKAANERLRTACELLQNGQPLPLSPDEVQMPRVDSLYELVEVCEQDHEVDITYGCAAEGVLHTAGLNHEPSEISEELRAEAERLLKEVKCNL